MKEKVFGKGVNAQEVVKRFWCTFKLEQAMFKTVFDLLRVEAWLAILCFITAIKA